MASVEVRNLTRSFGSHKALDDVSVRFEDGGFYALLGPSGSGKTTLLRMIAGFDFPNSGQIEMDGESVERVPLEKRQIGMMFQNYALFPNMTVAGNIAFGLEMRGLPKAEIREKVRAALNLVKLDALGERKPHQLSGGQRQRVALARAFVINPRVLLLDEPLGALDKALRVDMQAELKRIQREIGITTIFVTHDQEEAISMSDRIAVFNHGELVEVGRPIDLYLRPRKPFTATFLGLAELLPCTLLETEGQGGTALVKASFGEVRASRVDACQGHDARLLIRPEHIMLQPAASAQHGQANSYRGIVKKAAFAGRYIDYQIQLGRDTIAAQAPSTQFHQVGDEVAVHMPADRCVLLES